MKSIGKIQNRELGREDALFLQNDADLAQMRRRPVFITIAWIYGNAILLLTIDSR